MFFCVVFIAAMLCLLRKGTNYVTYPTGSIRVQGVGDDPASKPSIV